MTCRDATPLLLLAAIAWSSAAQGGTSATDLVVVVGLLLVALLLVDPAADRVRPARLRPALVAVLALEVWLIAAGTRGAAFDLVTLRVPVLVLIAALAVSVVRRLDGRQRAVLVDGLVLVGTVAAATAIGEVLLGPWPRSLPVRAAGLTGDANVLGVLLASTGALTLRALTLQAPAPPRRRTRLLDGALAVQAVALLLTGSRVAAISALGVVLWFAWSTPGVRTGRATAATVGFSAIALVVVAARFAATGLDRTALWRAALRQIALRPLAGRGPEPVVLDAVGSRIGPTTNAHDEILQLGMEYGLVAVVLLGVTLGVALRPAVWRTADPRLLAAAAPLLAAGQVDIGLRVTALTLLTAVVVTMAMFPRTPTTDRKTAARGPGDPVTSWPASSGSSGG